MGISWSKMLMFTSFLLTVSGKALRDVNAYWQWQYQHRSVSCSGHFRNQPLSVTESSRVIGAGWPAGHTLLLLVSGDHHCDGVPFTGHSDLIRTVWGSHKKILLPFPVGFAGTRSSSQCVPQSPLLCPCWGRGGGLSFSWASPRLGSSGSWTQHHLETLITVLPGSCLQWGAQQGARDSWSWREWNAVFSSKSRTSTRVADAYTCFVSFLEASVCRAFVS